MKTNDPSAIALLKEIDLKKEKLNTLIEKSSKLQTQILKLRVDISHLGVMYLFITGAVSAKLKEGIPALQPIAGVNAKLGDVLESLLKEHKTLDIHDAILFLRKEGVKLSLTNPRNVVANLVKQDKRFTRLEDGKITLHEK